MCVIDLCDQGAGEEDSKDGTKVAEGKAEGESSRGDKVGIESCLV